MKYLRETKNRLISTNDVVLTLCAMLAKPSPPRILNLVSHDLWERVLLQRKRKNSKLVQLDDVSAVHKQRKEIESNPTTHVPNEGEKIETGESTELATNSSVLSLPSHIYLESLGGELQVDRQHNRVQGVSNFPTVRVQVPHTKGSMNGLLLPPFL